MKKILVTGCNGQLGRAIRQEYKGEDVSFINTDVAEGEGIVALDITDVNAVLALVRAERPDVIINCAAHTNVDACEQQWDAAYRINAIGPRNLSIAAREVGAKMIHVSTDYVFEGNGTKPYTEFDEIHPVSAYGKTKAEGEKFVREFADRYFIFRTAWLYGDGKNFVKTMLRLAESHDEVSVVCDSRDPRQAQWNWQEPFIILNRQKIMVHFMQPVRAIPTGQLLRKQFLNVQERQQKSTMSQVSSMRR